MTTNSATTGYGLPQTSMLRRIRNAAKPVYMRVNNDETPIASIGTCFLVGYKRRVFALTAGHLVKNAPAQDILISPVDGQSDWLPLSNGYRFNEERLSTTDEYDAIAYEVLLDEVSDRNKKGANVLNLDALIQEDWRLNCYTSPMMLFGYPRERAIVDYDSITAKHSQFFLAGRYVESHRQPTLHILAVTNPLRLESFAGLSGSPVFIQHGRIGSSEVVSFCGLAITGTATSGLVHFLEASVIVELLQVVIDHSKRFGHFIGDPVIPGDHKEHPK